MSSSGDEASDLSGEMCADSCSSRNFEANKRSCAALLPTTIGGFSPSDYARSLLVLPGCHDCALNQSRLNKCMLLGLSPQLIQWLAVEFGTDLLCQTIDAQDAALYPSGTLFKGDAGTDTFGCEAAKNGLEWTVEPDLAGIAGTAHCLLFCEYMELAQKTTESGALKARPTRPFKRYWDVVFWERLFDLLINEEGTAQDVAALCLKNLSERCVPQL